MIIIMKPCQRWGQRPVLMLDLKVDTVAVSLRERRCLRAKGRKLSRANGTEIFFGNAQTEVMGG